MSIQGSFLVASNQLRDPNFYRTVVLMLEHNSESAMGLIVNRPSAVTVGKVLAQHSPVNSLQTPVYQGGPVSESSLFVLHNYVTLAKQDQEIAPGVFLVGSEESFDELIRRELPVDKSIKFRLICGYAGWGAGQLEQEIIRGDWHVLPADGRLVLEEDPYGLWEVCTRKFKRATRVLPHDVKNPEWN